jgi:hypothetical protein
MIVLNGMIRLQERYSIYSIVYLILTDVEQIYTLTEDIAGNQGRHDSCQASRHF